MRETIQFELPGNLEEDEFTDFITDNIEALYDAMDITANEHDNRSQVDDIRVTGIQLNENSVTINYEVEYSAYHGCRDINYTDTDEREAHGERQGSLLIFEKFTPPPPRSTHDEF